MRPAERRSEAANQVYLRPNVYLFGFGQTVPPRPKFIRKLYFLFLQRNIPPKAYSVKCMPACRPSPCFLLRCTNTSSRIARNPNTRTATLCTRHLRVAELHNG